MARPADLERRRSGRCRDRADVARHDTGRRDTWSMRSMAAGAGFSHTTIRRIWTAFGLQPHRSQTFKLSNDPLFVDKVRDIVGLYLPPPNPVLVLSMDDPVVDPAS